LLTDDVNVAIKALATPKMLGFLTLISYILKNGDTGNVVMANPKSIESQFLLRDQFQVIFGQLDDSIKDYIQAKGADDQQAARMTWWVNFIMKSALDATDETAVATGAKGLFTGGITVVYGGDTVKEISKERVATVVSRAMWITAFSRKADPEDLLVTAVFHDDELNADAVIHPTFQNLFENGKHTDDDKIGGEDVIVAEMRKCKQLQYEHFPNWAKKTFDFVTTINSIDIANEDTAYNKMVSDFSVANVVKFKEVMKSTPIKTPLTKILKQQRAKQQKALNPKH